jgi:hypothetical protein
MDLFVECKYFETRAFRANGYDEKSDEFVRSAINHSRNVDFIKEIVSHN